MAEETGKSIIDNILCCFVFKGVSICPISTEEIITCRRDSEDSWFSQQTGGGTFWFLRNTSLGSGTFVGHHGNLGGVHRDGRKSFSEDYVDTEESESIYATKESI